MTTRAPGVFCLEGEWFSDLRREQSIRSLLDFLRASGMIKFIHKDVSTTEEFANLAVRWGTKQYGQYPIGYWGFHGSPGRIYIGRRSLNLTHLGELLKGRCRGKTIYFGSCGTFDLSISQLQAFRKQIGAKCLVGYTEYVDWFESSAFDILLLDCLTFWPNTPRKTDEWLRSEHRALTRRLGFRMLY